MPPIVILCVYFGFVKTGVNTVWLLSIVLGCCAVSPAVTLLFAAFASHHPGNHARKLSLHCPVDQAGNGQSRDSSKRENFGLTIPLPIAPLRLLHRCGVVFDVGFHAVAGSSCACFNTTSPRLIRASPSRMSIDENALIDIPLCLLNVVSSACSFRSR